VRRHSSYGDAPGVSVLQDFTRARHCFCDFLDILCGTRCALAAGVSTARRFEDLIVWQLAVRIRAGVYALTETGPAAADFKFRDQIRNSASSAPRNISKGFLRYNPREFAQFLNVARDRSAKPRITCSTARTSSISQSRNIPSCGV
jgi:four helix bundle protein